MSTTLQPNEEPEDHTGTSSTKATLSDRHSLFNSNKMEFHAMMGADSGHSVPYRTPDTSYPPSEGSNADNIEAPRYKDVRRDADIKRAPSPSLAPHEIDHIPLQDRLLRILRTIPGHKEKKGFFPEKELQGLMTEENVVRELQSCFEDLDYTTISAFAQMICGTSSNHIEERPSFRKIFAILVLCEKPNSIPRFLEDGVSDDDLPLHKVAPSDSSPNIYNLSRKGEKRKLNCLRGWSYTAMWRFEEWQWTTIAPFFRRGQRKDVKHLELQDQAALPFMQDSRFTANKSAYQRLEFEGGFSNVFKVDIHPDHHDFFGPAVGCSTHEERTNITKLIQSR